ncbi:unnamed protein product, partial [Tetraodon nigroviridis]
RPFPSEDTALNEDDVYRSLEELADEHDLGEDDIYDCVPCEDDGDDIYEDIIKVEVRQPMIRYMQKMGMSEDDKRNCCLVEIQETEAKYYKTLEDIEKNYMIPLKQVVSPQDMEAIFVNLEDIIRVHFALLRAIDLTMVSGGSGLGKIFLDFKERLLIYGQYCSHMENAQKTLDELIATREDIKVKVEECTMKVQEGKFKLQDLLVVPMQRVLKYHLLLKARAHGTHDRPERQQLKEALEAMQDLAMYINEVKRDNETLKKISEFQSSIENLQQVRLEEYGRPKIDGELKVCSIVNRTKQDRYIFLFDKVVIVCKRKGYSYELKEIIELQSYKMSDDPMNNRDMKKSSGKMWSYGFYLIHLQGKQGFQFFCKTEETKRKWMEQFDMAMSNIKPERATANQHNFQMHTFEKNTNCRACKMLLRGIFYQGYYCSRCGTGAHKECLEVITICKISTFYYLNFLSFVCSGPKMVAVRNYHGTPAPPGKTPLCFQTGDFIELLKGDPDTMWWEGKLMPTQKSGFFPSSCVKPYLDPKTSREADYYGYPWFAGNMERQQADNLLKSHSSGTYLIRERTAEAERFAISIKFNDEVKHIKVIEKDSWIHITEAKKFESLLVSQILRKRTKHPQRVCVGAITSSQSKSVVFFCVFTHFLFFPPTQQELVEYYQSHSLKESFKLLDTTLRYPYKSRERSLTRASTRSPDTPRRSWRKQPAEEKQRKVADWLISPVTNSTLSASSDSATCASYNFSFLSPQGLNFSSSQSSAPFWSVFTPRVVSTAVARYNFAARDMRELSLREGDIVRIYSKIGGDQGWWKGEANGRIGWFPSTYVDEEGVHCSSDFSPVIRCHRVSRLLASWYRTCEHRVALLSVWQFFGGQASSLWLPEIRRSRRGRSESSHGCRGAAFRELNYGYGGDAPASTGSSFTPEEKCQVENIDPGRESTQTHILELIKELGLETYPQYNVGKKVYHTGRPGAKIHTYTSSIPVLSPLVMMDFMQMLWKAKIDKTKRQLGELEFLPCKFYLEATKFLPQHCRQGLGKFKFISLTGQALDRLLKEQLGLSCRTLFGLEASQMSFLFLLVYAAAAGGLLPLLESSPGSAQELKGGTQQLSERLAEHVEWKNIQLRAGVTTIRQDAEWARVITTTNTYLCRAVIVTCPPHLAAKIDYQPVMPCQRQFLMQNMPVGHMIKFIITYQTVSGRQKCHKDCIHKPEKA